LYFDEYRNGFIARSSKETHEKNTHTIHLSYWNSLRLFPIALEYFRSLTRKKLIFNHSFISSFRSFSYFLYCISISFYIRIIETLNKNHFGFAIVSNTIGKKKVKTIYLAIPMYDVPDDEKKNDKKKRYMFYDI